jgi:hypothetical protein
VIPVTPAARARTKPERSTLAMLPLSLVQTTVVGVSWDVTVTTAISVVVSPTAISTVFRRIVICSDS